MNYVIEIDEKDVTDKAVEFDGIVQEAEGDLLHSFFLDKTEVDFYISILDEFNIILKKKVKVYYYGQLVFYGFVTSKNVDEYKEEVVKLVFNSFGYELCKSPLSFYLKGYEQEGHTVTDTTKEDFKERAFTTLDTEKGDTIKDIVEKLAEYGYYAMKYKGFDVKKADVDVIDNIDFIDYMSLEITELNSQIHNLLGEKRKLRGIVREVSQDTSEPVNDNGYIVASGTGENDSGDLIAMGDLILIPIDTNGNLSSSTIKLDEKWDYPLPGDKITYTMVNYPSGRYPYLEIDDVEEDSLYKNEIKDIYNWDSLKFQGVYWVDDSTLILGASKRDDTFAKILKIKIKRIERFRYKYGQSTEIGNILKDIAKVSDSILYITPDCTIKLKDRKPVETAPNITKNDLINFDYNTEEYYTRSFNFPDGIKTVDTEKWPIKTNVIDHYNKVLNGKKTVYNYEFVSNGNIAERMLKKQIIDNIYSGTVKRIEYKEETIKVKSESQYSYFNLDELPNPFD